MIVVKYLKVFLESAHFVYQREILFGANKHLGRVWQAEMYAKITFLSTTLKAYLGTWCIFSRIFLSILIDGNTAKKTRPLLYQSVDAFLKKLAKSAPFVAYTPWQTKLVQKGTVAKSNHFVVKQDLSFKIRPFVSHLLVAKQKYAYLKAKNPKPIWTVSGPFDLTLARCKSETERYFSKRFSDSESACKKLWE